MAGPDERIKIFAHRGFSSRRPEMTLAAYREAIAFAAEAGVEIGLECDVQFAADDELICLHDLTVDRTSDQSGPAFDRTLAELRAIDFGAYWEGDRVVDDGRLMTLADLLALAATARSDGTKITLNLETKHPNPRGFAVDDGVAEQVIDRGWDGSDSPVRVISFAPASLVRIGRRLPEIRRTLLVQVDFGPLIDGVLPDGIDVVGPDLELIKADPGFVGRARAHGNEVHVWTTNSYDDIEFCLDLGVTGFTTDYPDRVLEVLTARNIRAIGDAA